MPAPNAERIINLNNTDSGPEIITISIKNAKAIIMANITKDDCTIRCLPQKHLPLLLIFLPALENTGIFY